MKHFKDPNVFTEYSSSTENVCRNINACKAKTEPIFIFDDIITEKKKLSELTCVAWGIMKLLVLNLHITPERTGHNA